MNYQLFDNVVETLLMTLPNPIIPLSWPCSSAIIMLVFELYDCPCSPSQALLQWWRLTKAESIFRSCRKELKRLYSDSAEDKVGSEYTRTVNDFFRMGLHRMQDYHPINRPHMRACYFAYFQNNKGAKKAVYKCVHEVDKEEKEVEQEEEAEEQPLNPPAQSELEAAAWWSSDSLWCRYVMCISHNVIGFRGAPNPFPTTTFSIVTS